MKSLILVLAMGLGVSYANAQKLKDTDVPQSVKSTFQKTYPSVKNAKWEKEEGNYEAAFEVNDTETSVAIDNGGKLLETETEINVSALPKGVVEYVTKNFPGKKISEAAKIVDADGKLSYEAEVSGKDYLFDSGGMLINKDK